MTKIDIISGFLGAGKTTLLNRLISDGYKGEKLVLIENEFGEIGIDGGFLREAGIQISEMNSGCICCSLVGDFSESLSSVIEEYSPDRILIEPSGVGKLSDVKKAVLNADLHDAVLNSAVVVVDATKCKMYMKNFGEFFNDQIEEANCIYFSHTDTVSEKKLAVAIELIRHHNADAELITTPAAMLDISVLVSAFENKTSTKDRINALIDEDECPVCGHHHHGHEHHHHHEHEHEHEHEHDDHDHDHEHCDCHEHEHEHHHDHCDCHEHEHEHHHDHDHCDCHDHHHGHEHHHHHHHHADEVFTSWGRETVTKYTKEKIEDILNSFENDDKYGFILRAKGIVQGENGEWIHFDYVPEFIDVRTGCSDTIGKVCVIGAKINEDEISKLFGI